MIISNRTLCVLADLARHSEDDLLGEALDCGVPIPRGQKQLARVIKYWIETE